MMHFGFIVCSDLPVHQTAHCTHLHILHAAYIYIILIQPCFKCLIYTPLNNCSCFSEFYTPAEWFDSEQKAKKASIPGMFFVTLPVCFLPKCLS